MRKGRPKGQGGDMWMITQEGLSEQATHILLFKVDCWH